MSLPRALPPRDPKAAIEARDVGVRYNLRLTRKNTLRETFRNMAKRGSGERESVNKIISATKA